MKRLFARFLLCLAMFALPFQGAAAAVMMVCSVAEAVGLSMPERHAAIKAEAEAEAVMDPSGQMSQMSQTGRMDHAHCHQAGMSDTGDTPVWHDAQPAGGMSDQPTDASHLSHHAAGHCSACGACAASAMLLPEIPLAALQHHRHALPLATPASFVSQLPLPADRPPARRC